jgi:hypothetical protein
MNNLSVTLEQLLSLINADHTINVYSEESNLPNGNEQAVRDSESPDYYTKKRVIKTTIYGRPQNSVDQGLLNRKVKCVFPYNGKLIVHLKNEEHRIDHAPFMGNVVHTYDDDFELPEKVDKRRVLNEN